MAKRKGLGRGLDSLIPDASTASAETWIEVSVDELKPNPFQPRTEFDQNKLEELAASVARHGVIQPLVIRRGRSGYEIVAGERRWRAARMVGLATVPAVIRDIGDGEMMQVALIENLQREDLNPIEEATAFRTLMEEFGLTQEALASILGRSRPSIANSVRLLGLPEEVREHVSRGTISMGHARAILSLDRAETRLRVCKEILAKGLTVRQAENLIRRLGQDVSRETSVRRTRRDQDPDINRVERVLEERLGTRVRIANAGTRGKVEIEYYSLEDLDRIVELIIEARQREQRPAHV